MIGVAVVTTTAAGVVTESVVGALVGISYTQPEQAADSVLTNATALAAAPVALTVAEQTVLGRITGGHIDDLTPMQVRTLLNVADGATANVGTVTGVTGTAPVVSSGGAAPAISMAAATASVDGYATKEQITKLDGIATGANNYVLADKAVTLAKMDDMATASLIYRKAAAAGVPEVQTLATLKTDLGLTGSNSGDQTIATLGLDADLATLALPANTTISAAGAELINDANSEAQLMTLGLTASAAELNVLDNIPATLTSTELGYVDGVTSAIQTQLSGKRLATIFSRAQEWEQDFYNGTAPVPLVFAAITAGTQMGGPCSPNHPGVKSIKTSTSADSGGYFGTENSICFSSGDGGESIEEIFEVDVTTGTLAHLGWHNGVDKNAPTRGIWLTINGTTVSGVCCADGGGSGTTGTTYTITATVWYRVKIALNAAANLVTFSLYTCANGALVWTDTVNTHIPNASTFAEINKATNSNGDSTPKAIVSFDWMHFWIDRVLVR